MIPHLLKIGSVVGAVMAIVGAWAYFELPRPAMSNELAYIEEQQLDMQYDYYRDRYHEQKLLELKLQSQGISEQDRRFIQKELDDTQRKLDEIERRKWSR